jgi:hypothetical protein
MDTTTLVALGLNIEGGRDLVQELRSEGFPLLAAMWYLEPESDEWQLMLASPLVTEEGTRAAYERVQHALQQIREKHPTLRLSQTVVRSPQEPLMRAVRTGLKLKPGSEGMWLAGTSLGDSFVNRAFVYFAE